MDSLHHQTQALPEHAKRQILHIEDNLEYARLVGMVLEANGYQVTHADEGLSGLLAFHHNPNKWSAVLVDLHLPNVSGNSLITEIHRARPDLPLIVLTGGEADTNLRVYEQGAVILWNKPISSAELLENLKAVIK